MYTEMIMDDAIKVWEASYYLTIISLRSLFGYWYTHNRIVPHASHSITLVTLSSVFGWEVTDQYTHHHEVIPDQSNNLQQKIIEYYSNQIFTQADIQQELDGWSIKNRNYHRQRTLFFFSISHPQKGYQVVFLAD